MIMRSHTTTAKTENTLLAQLIELNKDLDYHHKFVAYLSQLNTCFMKYYPNINLVNKKYHKDEYSIVSEICEILK